MENERIFLKCEHCGNIVGLIEDAGVSVVCCGEKMKRLMPNTVDASKEKHLPVLSVENGKLHVEVGSLPHPMTPEHHIAWIAVAQKNRTQRVALDVNGEPKADFCIDEGPVTVYAYCNLHGLWVSELK
ncbi:MAG: desulfoferrodoxin family protein [Bacillota bacterium]|nr:desulfoferrodoxin family protein [Bacillota bacterium]